MVSFTCGGSCQNQDAYYYLNSLTPGRFEWKFGQLTFMLMWVMDSWGTFCGIVLGWLSQDLTDEKSTLVQVMAWCRQATSHYLSQCWPWSMSPYVVTRPQWVKRLKNSLFIFGFTEKFRDVASDARDSPLRTFMIISNLNVIQFQGELS